MASETKATLSREALEFAPALLGIQESPPPKLPRTVIYSVFLLFLILLVWAIFGSLDVVASAEGRLIPKTYVKIVQPAEGGVVEEILVHEGDEVNADQVLMRMDANVTEADARAIHHDLTIKALQLRRIDAELLDLAMRRKPSDPPEAYAQAEAQYRAHRQAYADAVAQEGATLEKTRFDLNAAKEVLKKLEETVPLFEKNAVIYREMAIKGYVGNLMAQDKERESLEKQQDLRAQVATVASLEAGVATSEKRLSQIISNYRSGLHNERVDTELQFKKLTEEYSKIEHKERRLELRAPQRGVIKDLATHTQGTVVSPGTVLMTIVPQNEPLQAEVSIRNEDVGFVSEQQRVKVKLGAYPFQKYGMLDGTVIHVGADAMDTPSSSNTPQNGDPSALFRYKAIVTLDAQYLEAHGAQFKLSPGMQVIAEIHLGKRTVMEYLLSPAKKAWHEAGRER